MNQSSFSDFPERSETSKLASVIFEDIRHRGLRPGERYFNGLEIAEKYGVTLITANRALQSLAERNVLERRRRAGTFISGMFVESASEKIVHCVHLIMPVTYFRFSRTSVEQALFGINSELPDANIQHTFLPVSGELGFARNLLEQSEKNNTLGGVVLFVSSVEIQQFFRDSNVPSVVFGSVFPETSELPWIDRDQKQIGEVLVNFLVEEGHRKIAVLMRDSWGFGDNLLMDGAQHCRASSGGAISIRVRSVPAIEEVTLGTIKSLLRQEDAPTALICRSEKLARVAAIAAADIKIHVPKQLRIVVAETSSIFPCVVPTVTQEEQGAIIGRMLKQLCSGQSPKPHSVLIPVKFHNPLAS
ncbi:MAG: substrate-binding domain-containing protein [Verrucomicrobia bacterium]|nr:substrate-binding domain-containing protein [Verrucomicrobiota bacterium]